jgi:uncharacterized protein YegJ (DUF2314 family)
MFFVAAPFNQDLSSCCRHKHAVDVSWFIILQPRLVIMGGSLLYKDGSDVKNLWLTMLTISALFFTTTLTNQPGLHLSPVCIPQQPHYT